MSNAILHEHALGLTWTMDEPFERSSHALVDDGRVWLIDPIDDPVAVERAGSLGEIVGVIQLLDRHNRDCAALAARFKVAHQTNPDAVPGAPFHVSWVFKFPKWRETSIWWPQQRALVISEAIIAGAFAGPKGCAVHPMVCLFPPKRRLRKYTPEHLLLGHGPPIHGSVANEGLRDALARSRREAPKTLVSMFRSGS